MNLTRNFTLQEFACNDENHTPVPDELLPNIKLLAENLQVLRDFLGCPIQINSGYRTPAYNKKIGGAPLSQHVQGRAADIRTPKFTPAQVHAAILQLINEGKMMQGGVGFYDSWVHYDVRGFKARWDLRKHKTS